MSDLFTVEEHSLANELKEKAMTLTTLSLSGNDVALQNILSDLIKISAPKLNQKIKKISKQFESIAINERINREAAAKIADAIVKSPKSCLQVAANLIKIKNTNGNIVKYFKNVIETIKQKLGIFENTNEVKQSIANMMLSELSDEKQEKTTSQKLSAPSKDRDTGEILYHLDMATRHLDVLVDYTLVAEHAGEVTSISSEIQELAQRIRAELEAQRTPYDSEDREEDAKNRPLSSK